jgi:hypothetical protein
VQTLAYNAAMFSRAQVLRRDGTAPAALGIADDLPDRMAYQQLNILAGMAGKVSSSPAAAALLIKTAAFVARPVGRSSTS